MDEIVRQIGLKNNCNALNSTFPYIAGTFCGVFRRQALDRGAMMLKADKIVTGHNADDIAETVLLNRKSHFLIQNLTISPPRRHGSLSSLHIDHNWPRRQLASMQAFQIHIRKRNRNVRLF